MCDRGRKRAGPTCEAGQRLGRGRTCVRRASTGPRRERGLVRSAFLPGRVFAELRLFLGELPLELFADARHLMGELDVYGLHLQPHRFGATQRLRDDIQIENDDDPPPVADRSPTSSRTALLPSASFA